MNELLTGTNVAILAGTSFVSGTFLMMSGQAKVVGVISTVCDIAGFVGWYFYF